MVVRNHHWDKNRHDPFHLNNQNPRQHEMHHRYEEHQQKEHRVNPVDHYCQMYKTPDQRDLENDEIKYNTGSSTIPKPEIRPKLGKSRPT